MDSITEGLPRPHVSTELAARIGRTLYGHSGAVRELGSQQDRNFLIGEGDAARVLKIANPITERAELEAQHEMLALLADSGERLQVPAVIPTLEGEEIATVTIEGVAHAVRLLTFVRGRALLEAPHLDAELIASLGDLAGGVSRALAGLRHPGLERKSQWDLRSGLTVVRRLLGQVRDAERRALLTSMVGGLAAQLAALGTGLPEQPVHGDLTDDNVVFRPGADSRPRIAGIIDFGDAMLSWRVAELVMVCTAVLHRHPELPLAVLPAIEAFHRRQPLSEAEIAALWPLIVLRGGVLVVSGEQQLAVDPENSYAAEATEREWRVFSTAASLDPLVAEAAIRESLGLPSSEVPAPESTPLLDAVPRALDLDAVADWDPGDWLAPDAEPRAIAAVLCNGEAAVVRYGEPRLSRARLRADIAGPEAVLGDLPPATVPLFTELHLPEENLLRAPFAGRWTRERGGSAQLRGATHTLMIEGLEDDGATEPPRGVDVGDPLAPARGRLRLRLAVGQPGAGEPPLFVRGDELAAWRTRWADPTPLLGIAPAHRADPAEDLQRREGSFDPLQAHYYARPPQIERGWREFLIDTDGRHYLDMVNNVASVGHAHPRLAAAAADQWRRLNTNSRFHYRAVADYSEALLEQMPEGFDTVLLVNSGTEAVDLALRLGAAHSGRRDVLCVEESYHGWSMASDAVSTSTSDNPRAQEVRPDWVHALEAPNAYRGRHRGAGAGDRYADDAAGVLARLSAAGRPIGTFIAEPRNGNAGAIPTPPGYLARVYDEVRAGGGVVISDEIQVGGGRMGDVLFGFEEHGVVPDIVTQAKAIGNGHPLGAVITRRAIADSLADQGTFFSSSGGAGVSARIGLEVLAIMADEDLRANAQLIGTRLAERLEDLALRHPLIGAVHGRGLYLGVELVLDRKTREPAPAQTAALCDRLLELGVIVQPTGERQNVLKVKPPLCLSEESADWFADCLDRALGEFVD